MTSIANDACRTPGVCAGRVDSNQQWRPDVDDDRMKAVVWVCAIAVGIGLYVTVGESFRDKAAERACLRHAAENGWVLTEWEGDAWTKKWRVMGSCVFVDRRSGERFRVSTGRIDRGATYDLWLFAGTAISVIGIALALAVGNRLTGALD